MVIQYLHTMLPEYRPQKSRLHELAAEGEAAAVVFSACAHLSADQEKNAATLFQAACAETGLSGQQLLPASALGLVVKFQRVVVTHVDTAPAKRAVAAHETKFFFIFVAAHFGIFLRDL